MINKWMLTLVVLGVSLSLNASDIIMPAPTAENRVYTLNNMGAMNLNLSSQLEKQYLADLTPDDVVLDIGCAYGVTVKAALEKGVAGITANDLCPEHLLLLDKQVINHPLKDRVQYVPGDATIALTPLLGNQYSKILLSRVLMYMDGDKVTSLLGECHRLLQPSGKLYVLTTTPHLKSFVPCLPEYESRKAAGEIWPGYFTTMHDIDPTFKGRIPATYHHFDPDILNKAFETAGFEVESCGFEGLPYVSDQYQHDGKEYATAIVRKKAN